MAGKFPRSLPDVTRFHIKPNGEPGRCRALVGACPYGDELEHYTNPQDARTAFAKVMSGKPWTTHSKEKISEWRSKSWPDRKQSIEDLIDELCRVANVKKVTIRWEDELETDENRARGEWVYGKANPVKRYIRFSSKVEAMDELEAKENAIHEFAHILIGKAHESDDGHSDEWRLKCEELAQRTDVFDEFHEFEDGTEISSETARRIREHEGMKRAPRWRGLCVHGHRDDRDERPATVRLCQLCLAYFHERNYPVWEEL